MWLWTHQWQKKTSQRRGRTLYHEATVIRRTRKWRDNEQRNIHVEQPTSTHFSPMQELSKNPNDYIHSSPCLGKCRYRPSVDATAIRTKSCCCSFSKADVIEVLPPPLYNHYCCSVPSHDSRFMLSFTPLSAPPLPFFWSCVTLLPKELSRPSWWRHLLTWIMIFVRQLDLAYPLGFPWY